jgi:hypothetical protein
MNIQVFKGRWALLWGFEQEPPAVPVKRASSSILRARYREDLRRGSRRLKAIFKSISNLLSLYKARGK